VRADGGQYGLLGSLILVVVAAAERLGEGVSGAFVKEIVKGVAFDFSERIHGIGAGQCRDAAWVLQLWADATGTPLRIDDLPIRHPLPTFDEWVRDEFEAEYTKGLTRVGLPAGEAPEVPTSTSNPDATTVMTTPSRTERA